MSIQELNSNLEELNELEKEYNKLEETHKNYLAKVSEVKGLQKKCLAGIQHQKYRMNYIVNSLKSMKRTASPDEVTQITEIESKIAERQINFRDMEESLPRKNGMYLNVILGHVNVSLLSKADRWAYKEDYEHFKLVITTIVLISSFLLLTVINSRMFDAAFHFLLVWYYCTMTIREHILIANGSRIKGWWILHHIITTVGTAILLIWPDGYTYRMFRTQQMIFSFYLFFTQLLQCNYQKGCLYRLRALGQKHSMDITVDGFQSWMWKGLSFLLPFLFGAYIFQFYNAYVLYHLSYHPQCKEWQVQAASYIFFVLFLGNMWTTLGVVRQKLKKDGLIGLPSKYKFYNNANGKKE